MPRNSLPEHLLALSGQSLDGSESATREVEVLLTGQYKTRNFALAEKQMGEMIANHAASNVDPAIDREHESWSGDGDPEARGWVKALRMAPSAADPKRTALVATVEFNDLGLHALKNKHFRYLSAGIDLKGKNRLTGEPIGAVLDHVALCKNPFVQGMQPLSLSANSGQSADGDQTMNKFALALGLAADATEEIMLEALAKRTEADKAKDAEIVSLRAKAEAGQVAVTESETLSKRVKALETERLAVEVDGAVKAFRLDPSERDEWVGLAAKDEPMFRRLLALRQPKDPSGPKLELSGKTKAAPEGGRDLSDAAEKLVKEWLAANPGKTEVDALMACAADKPELFPMTTGEV